MKKKEYNADHKTRICDPGMCNHCIYIGEGDFICDQYHDEKGNPAILVVEDWQANENYMKCKKGWRGYGKGQFRSNR